MKIKLLIPISQEGREFKEGSIIEIKDDNAAKWISKGWGELISSKEKKEAKPKKETKELKIDSKETKNETSKD